MKRHEMVVDSPEEKKLRAALEKRADPEAARMKRFLAMPDLSRTKMSPIKALADKVLSIPMFKDFDVMDLPEIVSTKDNFDLLNTPKDHPSRKPTDTYYADPSHVLRTHTTVM